MYWATRVAWHVSTSSRATSCGAAICRRAGKRYFSSPLLAGDKLYCPREDGVIFVGRVSDDGFELLAENDMGEPTIAAPVPIDGGLLIRGREHLFRIEP